MFEHNHSSAESSFSFSLRVVVKQGSVKDKHKLKINLIKKKQQQFLFGGIVSRYLKIFEKET